MTRPFRFGVHARDRLPGLSWADTARKVEDLGFSTLKLPDHFQDQLAVTPALAVAAEVTTTLRLGAEVFGNDYRHPVVLAQEMATLDVLSGGRIEIGLGAGWLRSDYEQAGMAYDRPGVRIERMAEAVEVIYGLFGPEPLDYRGKHYTIGGLNGMPKPVQARPPLLIGGGGPKMLGVAAQYADIVGVNPDLRAGEIGPEIVADVTAERFDAKLGWVRDAAGDRISQIELSVLVNSAQITSGGKATRDALRATAELFGRTPKDVAGTPMVLIGSPPELADTLRQRRERWGFSYIVVQSSDDLDAFSTVIEELDGE